LIKRIVTAALPRSQFCDANGTLRPTGRILCSEHLRKARNLPDFECDAAKLYKRSATYNVEPLIFCFASIADNHSLLLHQSLHGLFGIFQHAGETRTRISQASGNKQLIPLAIFKVSLTLGMIAGAPAAPGPGLVQSDKKSTLRKKGTAS
jgi:hypothetical protein